ALPEMLVAAGRVDLFLGPLTASAAATYSENGLLENDHLGTAVAITSALLPGSSGALVVGSPGGRTRAGAPNGNVRLLHLIDGTQLEDGVIPGLESYDNLGASVLAAGDLFGDGLDDLVAGAPFADGAGDDAGRVHLYR
ncbi:MAG: integrin alpha, partial [Pseudomonadota bacterium]